MKKFEVEIEGITPLLMNKPSQDIIEKSKDVKRETETSEQIAFHKLYEIEGKIYTPATHLQGSLIEAGKFKKKLGRGTSKANYSKTCGYAVEIEPFEIIHEIQDWEVFSIQAVNPTTRGRNILHRPMFKNWKLKFFVNFDEEEIEPEVIKEIFDIAGRKVGIGDWRPAKKGRFGKFQIIKWKECD